MSLHSTSCKSLAERFRAKTSRGRQRTEDRRSAKRLMRPSLFFFDPLEPRLLFSAAPVIELASQPPLENPLIATNTAPTVVTPAAASPATVTGTTTHLSVTASDDGGAGNLSYDWSVLSKPAGAMGPTFSVNGNNSASGTTATFYLAGNYQFEVTITDSGGLSTTSVVSVAVSQTLSSIAIAPPATMTTSSTQQLTATALDQFGSAMVAQPGLTWSASSGSFTGNGLYHSTSSAGAPTVTASGGGISGQATLSVVKSPAALASPNTVNGTTTTLTAVGMNSGLLYTFSWSVTAKPSGAKTPTFSDSSSTTTTVTFYQAGTYTFEAQSALLGLLSSSATIAVTVNQTLTSISVTPASPSIVENASQQFAATGSDQFGKAMTTQPAFQWAVTSGGGNFSGAAGNYVAPGAPTTATVAAISGSVWGSATVTVVNAVPTVATPAQATPNPVTGASTDLSALGADDGGESNLTYTWSAISKPSGAQNPSFSLNSSNAAKDTAATFSAAGTYKLQATITDSGGLSTTSSVTVLVYQTLTSISVSPASASVVTSATKQFTATGLDQFGQSMTVQPAFNWSATSGASVDATGLYTAPGSPGPDTVIATSGSISGSADIAIVNIGTAVASPSPVTGTTTNLSVLGGATSGVTYTWSIFSEPLGTTDPTFSVNGSSAAQTTTATFSVAGNYTFQVAIDTGTVSYQTVAVTVLQTLASIAVTPGTANLNENMPQGFSALGYDQFGNVMSSQPAFAWVVSAGGGAIDGNGLYTAAGSGGSGSATVTASSGSVSGDASITVTNAAPSVATIAAATPSPVTGTSTQLSVLGADDGGESNLIYTWSVTGTSAPVSFSTNGSNVSKNVTATFTAAGTYQLLATIEDAEGAATTSSVIVQVVPTFTSVAVTPANSSLERAASEPFSATALDQFGVALASQPGFTWSTLGSVGAIDSSGDYSAPDAGIGYATVIAASGSLSGSATVALDDELSATVPGAQNTVPNTSVVFADSDAISISDGDAATQSVPLSLTLAATDGVISLSGSGSGTATITLSGSLASINSSLQGLTFTPTAGFSGAASLSVTINETGIGRTSPSSTIPINVRLAAANPEPSGGATSGTGTSSNSGGNSGIATILNQPSPTTGGGTATQSSSSGGTYSNIFSEAPIIASPAPTPTPAPVAPPANSGPQHSNDGSPAKSAPEAHAAAPTNQPPTQTVPDVRVETVPDQVFKFLAPQSAMFSNLDTVKSQLASQKPFKVAAGSATIVSFGASAAYLIWLLRGGSLLSSLLSIFPAWKSMDPLPVLESFENSRKRKKERSERDAESLESLVDRSNRNAREVKRITDENAA
jgi:hypothetical protein